MKLDIDEAVRALTRCQSRWFGKCDGEMASVRAAERIVEDQRRAAERIVEDQREAERRWYTIADNVGSSLVAAGILGIGGFRYRQAAAGGIAVGFLLGAVQRHFKFERPRQ